MKKPEAEIAPGRGEPEHYEIERKFLIEYPDIPLLESLPDCRRADIVQTYLLSSDGDERRVRLWEENGSSTYFQTTKRRVSDIRRVEIERRVTRREYLTLLTEADPALHPVRKTRYCLSRDGRVFEIDVYPFWTDRAVLEIELRDENEEICFPPELKVIREVTGDEAYKNTALARSGLS